MNPQLAMLESLLAKPISRGKRRPSQWKVAILRQLETLKDLARETWGADVANKWNEPIVLVQGWQGDKQALRETLAK